MTENSKIEWTDHTFNPWVGCEKVSPACAKCYAESWAKRTGNAELWQGERRRTSEANWKLPLKWNREAAAAGVIRRVFCASLADVFDNAVPPRWRADLFRLIHDTPHLDWLLLTKRIGNAVRMIDEARSEAHLLTSGSRPWPWPNVWLGATVANREEMLRDGSKLMAIPARVHFWSYEPALGDLGFIPQELMPEWVIVGGESGGGARSLEIGWVSRIVEQCAAFGVPCFVKQLGARPLMIGVPWRVSGKGGDTAEWPVSLVVREFPA